MIGPPRAMPQRLSGSIGPTTRVSLRVPRRSSRLVPRRSLFEYSKKASPWNWLPPDRVTTLIAQPVNWPYSTSNGANWTWVSRTASKGTGVELRDEKPVSLRP